MTIYNEDNGQDTEPQPRGLYGPVELPETPAHKALLKGFDAIGQPYHDQPDWRERKIPALQASDFNMAGYQMPKSPDIAGLYEPGNANFIKQDNSAHKASNLHRPGHKPYLSGFSPDALTQGVSNAPGTNWNDRDTDAYGNDVFREEVRTYSDKHGEVLKPLSWSAAPSNRNAGNARSAAQTPVTANQVRSRNPDSTPNHISRIDHEFMQSAEACGMGDIGDILAGTLSDYGSLGTSVTHGDHTGQALTNVYNADPERFSTRTGAIPKMDEHSWLQPISDEREAQGIGILEDGVNLYRGLNLSKDKRLLNLERMLYTIDHGLKAIDSRHQTDESRPGAIRELQSRIEAGKWSDERRPYADIGEKLQHLRGSFYKDIVGQKLIDVIESLASGQVSLAWNGLYHAVSTASEMYVNDALENGKGDLLRAVDYGGGNAMKVSAFKRSMRVLGDAMPPKTRALFGVIIDVFGNDMRQKTVERVRSRPGDRMESDD